MKSDKPVLHKEIEKTYWGEVDEKPVWLYTLSTKKGLRMKVTNYGAIVQALCVPNADGSLTDVVLGYDTLADYIADPFYVGGIVGRCTNRIASGKITIHGKTYSLNLTPGGFHHHGGHVGFNKKTWEAETFVYEDAVGIILKYTSPDREEGYPGNLIVTVTYTLHEEKRWSVEFLASTDQTTIVNMTQHSYFNLGGHNSGTITDHTMQSDALWFLEANEKLMPTGEVVPVANTPFNFQLERKIGDRIDSPHAQLINSKGYDHFMVLKTKHNHSLKKAATFIDPKSGRKMEVFTTEPGFHFYTGNFLANSFSGKNQKTYHCRGGFCIETHHFPDAPNHPHFPSIILEPGEQFKSRTEFVFK